MQIAQVPICRTILLNVLKKIQDLGVNSGLRIHINKVKNKVKISCNPCKNFESKVKSRKDDRFCQSVLVLMWTGLRISEFLNLKKSDVFLEERYFIIPKGKTVNAKRKVPIAEAIYPFFADWYNNGNSEYLYLNAKHPENPVSYDQYLKTFKKLMDSMGLNYTPHATRHTFTSLLADLDVSSTIRAKLNGQSLGNVTETVYTHLDLSVLLEAVNKLECFIE